MHYGPTKNRELAEKICNTIRWLEPSIWTSASLFTVVERFTHKFSKTEIANDQFCKAFASAFLSTDYAKKRLRSNSEPAPNKKQKKNSEKTEKAPMNLEGFFLKKKKMAPIYRHHGGSATQVAEDHSHNDMYKYKMTIHLTHKKLHKRLGYYEYHTQHSGYIQADEGKQGRDEINAFGHALQIFGNTAPSDNSGQPAQLLYNLYKWQMGPWAMNPYKSIPNGTMIGADMNPAIDKIHLEYIESTTILCNTQSVPTQCEMVWLAPKHDASTGPLGAWNEVLSNKGIGVDENDQPNFTDVSPNAYEISRCSSTMYGQSPFGHKEFRRNWKTLHRKSFYLNAGDQKKVMQKIYYNKTWDKTALATVARPDDVNNAVTAENNWLKGFSICVMLIVRPGTVVLPGSDENHPTAVTTGLGQITYLNSNRFVFSSMGSTDRISDSFITPTFYRESASLKTGRLRDVKDDVEVDDKMIQT